MLQHSYVDDLKVGVDMAGCVLQMVFIGMHLHTCCITNSAAGTNMGREVPMMSFTEAWIS